VGEAHTMPHFMDACALLLVLGMARVVKMRKIEIDDTPIEYICRAKDIHLRQSSDRKVKVAKVSPDHICEILI
jgi:hypothetical protein